MLTIGGFAIDISKIIEGVLIAALGGIVGFAIGKMRDIRRKKKKREAKRKELVKPILAQLNDVVESPDIGRCKNIAQMIANNWITHRTKCLKADEDAQTYIRYFMEDLYHGRCQRVLRRSDTISDIREKLKLSLTNTACDETKARVFINTSGEKEMGDYEKCLENELLLRCKTKIDSWSGNENRTRVDCHVLVFGGMRIDVVRRLIDELHESVKCPVFVGVYKKSVSKSFVSELMDFAKNELKDITIDTFEDGTLTEGYDVIICTHYWQHRPLGDLMNMRFHLKEGGLLIWLSATSRGSGKRDVEFVCEGLPPLSPSSVATNFDCTSHNSKEQPYGVAIPYTPMGQYCREKKWIKYDCLTWGCQFFYDCHLPKSYIACAEDVRCCFDSVTSKFLTWYLSKFGFSEVSVETEARISANDETRKRFGDEHYIICSVTYTKKDDSTPISPQYLIAVVARLNNNNHLVSLYPCVRTKSSRKNLSRDGIMTFLRDTKMSDQHIAVDREYVACDKSSYVFRVLSRIRCPIAKQYLFSLSEGWMYVACLPTRTYLTQSGYEAARKKLVDYDARIEDFKRENGSKARFCPYRMDSVTILMPYDGIKGILAERYIYVDDNSTFFHKCYGAFNESVPHGLTKSLPNDDLKTLKSEIASVEKDCTFNKLKMPDRLKLLGCMNVHDVLLFGIKKK